VFADKQALACGGLSVYTKFCTPSSQRKSITFKANNVDKRCGIIQLGPGTDGLTKNIDLAYRPGMIYS